MHPSPVLPDVLVQNLGFKGFVWFSSCLGKINLVLVISSWLEVEISIYINEF